MAILKPRVLQEVLSEANSGGVYAALLLNNKGSPIAQATLSADTPTAAIAAHIWKVRVTFLNNCPCMIMGDMFFLPLMVPPLQLMVSPLLFLPLVPNLF